MVLKNVRSVLFGVWFKMKNQDLLSAVKSKVKNENIIREKRLKIIQAARELLVKEGFHGATMRNIAKKSGINLSYLYSYIETKGDILYLVYDYLLEKSSTLTDLLRLDKDEDPRLQMKKFLEGAFYFNHAMGQDIRLMYSESRYLNQKHLDNILLRETEVTVAIKALIEKGLRAGVFNVQDSYIAAAIVQFLLLMYCFRGWTIKQNCKFEHFVEKSTGFILRGLGVSEREIMLLP